MEGFIATPTTHAHAEHSASRSWTYGEVAAVSLSRRLEDHLLAAVRKLTCRLDLDGVCDAVLAGVEGLFGATASWIMLHDVHRQVLRTQLFRGPAADVFHDVEIPVDPGTVTGRVFHEHEVVFVADVAGEPHWFDPGRIHASNLKSMFILPLIVDGTAIGILGVDSPEFDADQPPGPLAAKRLELLAAQAAIGIANARLYEQSQRDRARLRALLQQKRELRGRITELNAQVRSASLFGSIVGRSSELRDVFDEIVQVAASDVTVLLSGETGTGKELMARALHEHSRRAGRPFIAVNCAALPEHLIESEMFGHERGAFTGAHARKPGRFELAHRGTLFLDEVADLPLAAQAKLLRALQDGHVQRVGGTSDVSVDVRVVAATNQDLLGRVADKGFREDLYYRLNVFPVRLPPLRDRHGDVPVLAQHFAAQFAERLGRRIEAIDDAALDKLASYSWPGNVRELQNVIERAVILARGRAITADCVRLEERPGVASVSVEPPPASARPAAQPVRPIVAVERDAIVQALVAAEGKISGPGGAAALLGLKPTTLHARMKKLGLRRQDALRRPTPS